jgi:hypothetical protein
MKINWFFCKEWAASFSVGHKGKNFSFPIRAINFFETFCTCSPNSLGQDLTVEDSQGWGTQKGCPH